MHLSAILRKTRAKDEPEHLAHRGRAQSGFVPCTSYDTEFDGKPGEPGLYAMKASERAVRTWVYYRGKLSEEVLLDITTHHKGLRVHSDCVRDTLRRPSEI